MKVKESENESHSVLSDSLQPHGPWNSPGQSSAMGSQQKSLKCSTWMQSQKRQNDLGSFPRQTIHYHSNPSLCPNQ